MNYTITLKDGDNLIVNQKQAEMAQKIKREGKGVININGEDIYAEHIYRVKMGITKKAQEEIEQRNKDHQKQENDAYYEEIDKEWRNQMLVDKNASINIKNQKSVFYAEKLMASIQETLTDEMREYIIKESTKFFDRNPNKVYYDQMWFVAYLKKHKKRMHDVGYAFASLIIKNISNANLIYK